MSLQLSSRGGELAPLLPFALNCVPKSDPVSLYLLLSTVSNMIGFCFLWRQSGCLGFKGHIDFSITSFFSHPVLGKLLK